MTHAAAKSVAQVGCLQVVPKTPSKPLSCSARESITEAEGLEIKPLAGFSTSETGTLPQHADCGQGKNVKRIGSRFYRKEDFVA